MELQKLRLKRIKSQTHSIINNNNKNINNNNKNNFLINNKKRKANEEFENSPSKKQKLKNNKKNKKNNDNDDNSDEDNNKNDLPSSEEISRIVDEFLLEDYDSDSSDLSISADIPSPKQEEINDEDSSDPFPVRKVIFFFLIHFIYYYFSFYLLKFIYLFYLFYLLINYIY